MKAKVTKRGRVTIPKALRDSLGIQAGTVLEFREDNGRLVLIKSPGPDALEQVYGILSEARRSDEVMAMLRG